MYSTEEALEASLAYFNEDQLAADVFVNKYALRDVDGNLLEKTPEQMHKRLAKEFARIERKKFAKPLTEKEIYSLLDRFKYIVPQGSPMYGVGNKSQYVTLSNCYVVHSPDDSYGGILYTDSQLAQICKRRGGVGVDISKLRPDGTITHNAARSSTGILSFMERFSNTIREVGQHNRRGALMISISVHHPEILDFIKVKQDLEKVTGANISIRLTDEFLNAVSNNEDYELRWPIDQNIPETTEMVSAKGVWKEIIHSAHKQGEPGLLFWDNIIRESPADCYEGFETVSTNPCSELPLSEFDSCRLMLLNLLSYVTDPFTRKAEFDFELFYEHAQILQRLMDDMVDLEIEAINRIIKKIQSDPEPDYIKESELYLWNRIKWSCENGRRSGSGITALGDTIAALGLKYGSPRSIEVTEDIYRTLKLGCYRSSVDMAKELGPFPAWKPGLDAKNVFIKRLRSDDADLYADMKKFGRRNIALLTTAPAGSVSLLTQTSSGIEPVFNLSYIRRKKINHDDTDANVDFVDKKGDKWTEFTVYHNAVQQWMEVTSKEDIEESPWWGACAEDINWKSRVKLQAAAQSHVDHSISSTINLPEDVTVEQVAEIYETAWKTGVIKGITVYRANSRTGVLVNESQSEDSWVKRPKELPCDIFHPTVKGKQYFVLIGLKNGQPYEIFAGENGMLENKTKEGVIFKQKRGHYKLLVENEIAIDNITQFDSEEEEALTRLVSTSVRHNVPLGYVQHQLEKVGGDLTGFARSVARTLKRYVADGTALKGEECPECAGSLIRAEGCVQCKTCGWTKCS